MDNTIDANYNVIPFTETFFFFPVFVFNINRKITNDFLKSNISEKVIKSGNEVWLPYVELSINPVFKLKMIAYHEKANNELNKYTTGRKVNLSFA